MVALLLRLEVRDTAQYRQGAHTMLPLYQRLNINQEQGMESTYMPQQLLDPSSPQLVEGFSGKSII
jgi:hypothetical protein